MAGEPDAHPDSGPSEAGDSSEQVRPAKDEGRTNVEDTPGDFGGTAGTGGENKAQDQSFER